VNAYIDNRIDVQTLLDDSDTKSAALEKVAELDDALSQVEEIFSCIFDSPVEKISKLVVCRFVVCKMVDFYDYYTVVSNCLRVNV